jgi:hypothetical protein
MSIQLLSVAMGDNQGARLPNPSYPLLTGMISSRRYTEQLLASAGILTSVGQDDNQKPEETRPKRFPADTSGIVSHLRASSSSRQGIDSTLRAKGKSLDHSLSQQIRAVAPYGYSVSMLPPMNRYAHAPLLFSQNAARDAAAASLAQSIGTPSFSILPSSLFSSKFSVSRTLGGFSLAKHAFGQDPRFARNVPAGFPPYMTKPVKRRPIVLFMDCDEESLSEYQCLIRQQIELFEADKEEAASSVQGRNKQIVEGQVGIRCRHCTVVPPRRRQKGCMYFPTKLDRIYQAAQNLSAFHLCEHCKHVPQDVRKKILVLRERKSPAGGGKRYWAEGVRCLRVYEDTTGLRFRKS